MKVLWGLYGVVCRGCVVMICEMCVGMGGTRMVWEPHLATLEPHRRTMRG